MTKTQVFDRDGKPINDNTLPDGGRLRTYMTLMDAAQIDIAAITRSALADADRDLADIMDIMDITTLADRQPTAMVTRNRPGTIALRNLRRGSPPFRRGSPLLLRVHHLWGYAFRLA